MIEELGQKGVQSFNKPLVTVITAVFNGDKYLEDAIQSVINQEYDNVEYIIIDGGSTDATVDIIKKYEGSIAFWISEKDDGLYNALNKGFKHANGEILCWLNCDDIFYPNAIKDVVDVFNKYPNVEWLTRRKVIRNEENQYLRIGCFQSYNQAHIRKGYYRGGVLWHIMQEGTFWRRSLFGKVGFVLNEELSLASDFELWTKMAMHAPLYSLNSILASFRLHEGQLSEDNDKYLQECETVKKLGYRKYIISKLKYFFYIHSLISKKHKIQFGKNGPRKVTKLFELEGNL